MRATFSETVHVRAKLPASQVYKSIYIYIYGMHSIYVICTGLLGQIKKTALLAVSKAPTENLCQDPPRTLSH
jgi:hypothetical protein